MRKSVLTCLAVAITVNITAAAIYGVSRPMESDAMYYLDIAKNLVAGKGFVLTHGFWPDQPTMSRSPAWPAVVAVALLIEHSAERMAQRGREAEVGGQRSAVRGQRSEVSGELSDGKRRGNHRMSPDGVMRILCLLLNSLNALLVTLLALKLGANRLQSAIAALLYIFYPTALYLALGGASEILFLTLALAGVMLLLDSGCDGKIILPRSTQRHRAECDMFHESETERSARFLKQTSRCLRDLCGINSGSWSFFLGFLLLGCAALVRANFVIWIAVFGVVITWSMARSAKSVQEEDSQEGREVREGRSLFSAVSFMRYALCALLFLAPSLLWAMRNYGVCGKFPVLSTLRGQTFYGGNNPVVQRLGQYWGYWVFPDEIAGETTMRELAKSMSEAEIDRYYTHKGQEFIRANWRELPLLAVGKLVRAYVPVPWKLSPGLLVVNGYRFLLYMLIAVGLWRLWRQTPVEYRLLAISMVLVNVITVIGFWGCARFAFAIEPFFIPFAVMWKRENFTVRSGRTESVNHGAES